MLPAQLPSPAVPALGLGTQQDPCGSSRRDRLPFHARCGVTPHPRSGDDPRLPPGPWLGCGAHDSLPPASALHL